MERNVQKIAPEEIRIIRKPMDLSESYKGLTSGDGKDLSVGNAGRQFQFGGGANGTAQAAAIGYSDSEMAAAAILTKTDIQQRNRPLA